jgi:hypothetical protein
MFSSPTVVYFFKVSSSILKHKDYTLCYWEPNRLTVKIGRLPEPLNKISINLEWGHWQYSQHFILFVNWDQKVTMLHYTRVEKFASDKNSGLLGPLVGREGIKYFEYHSS